MMPQLDQFAYFTQFFWCCLIFLAYYLCLCNDGLPRPSRILKLRNQLVPPDNIRIKNPSLGLEEVLVRVFLSGTSYMYSSLSEISRWCDADLLGRENRRTSISCFGEISGSQGMILCNILHPIPEYSPSTTPNPLSVWRNPGNKKLIHVLHSQVNI